jgi:hypothetical protein
MVPPFDALDRKILAFDINAGRRFPYNDARHGSIKIPGYSETRPARLGKYYTLS